MADGTRSLPDVIADLFGQLTTLFRTEVQLARAEMSENIGQAVVGIAMIIAGAVLLIPALVILLQAGVAALVDYGLAEYWAALIVGGLALLLGIVLALIGVNRLKAENLKPKRTIHQLQRDAAVAKQQVRSP